MSSSNTRNIVILAVGLTALFTSVVLIAGFVGYLYLRPEPEPRIIIGSHRPADETTPPSRPKGPNQIAAADIIKITLFESTLANRADNSPRGFFSNINVQNYSSSTSTFVFAADGSATKHTASDSTVNGVKAPPKNERFSAAIDPDSFSKLARVFADNDFSNEPDSREISTLPKKLVLTITHKNGEKVINLSNMGKHSPEVSAMLDAVKAADNATKWEKG